MTRWGGLLAFFKWATGERLCDGNPMADVERPQRPELLTPILTDAELRRCSPPAAPTSTGSATPP